MTGNTAAVAITYNRSDSMIYILDAVNMTEPTPAKDSCSYGRLGTTLQATGTTN
jgi:hypothetical protein